MTQIEDLPLEILRLIFGSLPKSDLKKLRYMNNTLNQAVVPSLFNQVILAPSELDMENARKVVRTFGRHVTHLILVCVRYQNLSFDQYQNKHQRRNGNYRTASKEDEKSSYGEYQTLRLAQEMIEQTNEDVILMRRALMAAPSIQTIEIDDQWPTEAVQASYREMSLNRHCGSRDSPWDFPILCPLSGYDLTRDRSRVPAWIRPLTIVAQALEATCHQIRTFRVSHSGALRLPLKALDHLRLDLGDQYKFFRYLRSLDLRLGVQDHTDKFTIASGLVRLLNTAGSLETLQLSFDEDAARVFAAVAAGVRFPHLKNLSLESCTTDARTWVAFFTSHGNTLRTLIGLRLTVDRSFPFGYPLGSWEAVLEKGIRKIRLSKVEVRELWDGSIPMGEEFLERMARRGLDEG
ncbi:MAG: hypothetical protein Q9187_002646 [Circinaria calcarea]